MLEPLRQWKCDFCGELIESPEDGWVEWLQPQDSGASEFHIVHNAPKSPYWTGQPRAKNCFHHSRNPDRKDVHLDTFLGTDGLARLLSFLDDGIVNDPAGDYPPKVANWRSYVEIFRRLTIPYYEEARLYLAQAASDGEFPASAWALRSDRLKEVIDRYSTSSS